MTLQVSKLPVYLSMIAINGNSLFILGYVPKSPDDGPECFDLQVICGQKKCDLVWRGGDPSKKPYGGTPLELQKFTTVVDIGSRQHWVVSVQRAFTQGNTVSAPIRFGKFSPVQKNSRKFFPLHEWLFYPTSSGFEFFRSSTMNRLRWLVCRLVHPIRFCRTEFP